MLTEIIDAFLSESPTAPSPRVVTALARASGLAEGEVCARFEAQFRAAGHETTLFDSMPFSGSG